MGFGSKCSILNGQVIYIKKSKWNIADMWLIPLDRVTIMYNSFCQVSYNRAVNSPALWGALFFFSFFIALYLGLVGEKNLQRQPPVPPSANYWYVSNKDVHANSWNSPSQSNGCLSNWHKALRNLGKESTEKA